MSNTGYYSAVYDELREYSSLIESVLRQLKGDLNSRTTPEQQKLGALLRDLATGRPTSLRQLCIANVLRTTHRREERFEKLAASLDSVPRSSDVIQSLEELANSFEEGRSQAIAKLRGTVR